MRSVVDVRSLPAAFFANPAILILERRSRVRAADRTTIRAAPFGFVAASRDRHAAVQGALAAALELHGAHAAQPGRSTSCSAAAF